MACPAHTNAGRYVALIAEGRFEEAYKFARDPNPLASICGRVCAHPCETACRRGDIDRPIAIRALKRFLTERHGPESKHSVDINARRGQNRLPFKVAVVGGGPVGLSAAHDLALMGYSVTICEAAPVAGLLVSRRPELRPSAAHRGYVGHAQFELSEWRFRLFAGKPRVHVLSCSAQWLGRQHAAVESEAVAEIVRPLHQHHRS